MGDRVEGDKNVNTSESGQRSISIEGSAQGVIIITGDGNITGDTSSYTIDRQAHSAVDKVKELSPLDHRKEFLTNSSLKIEPSLKPVKPLISMIRQLVEDALSNDELINLCQDEFTKVYNQFTTGQTKSQRIGLLIEYVQRQREVPKLLAAIENLNPTAYTEFIDNTRYSIPTPLKAPRVFISYSYDSDEQINRVIDLANRLRREGVDCNIDRYELSSEKDWSQWMIDEIEKSDFVLMISTIQYIQIFQLNEKKKIGVGVNSEGSIITQKMFEEAGKENSKYIPVFFETTESIPKIFGNTPRYSIENQEKYELLYRRLTNQFSINLKILPALVEHKIQYYFTHSTSSLKKDPCNLPRKSYRNFVGRRKEIIELLERISPEYRQHITIISGIGGVGKTALAVEVASQCWNNKKNKNNNENNPIFDAIIFTSSKTTNLVNTQILNRPEKEAQLTDIFRVIADVLDEPTITQVLPEEQHRKVKEVLSKQPTLLIVDNMETLSDSERINIMRFLDNVPKSTQVLITTREFMGLDNKISIESLTRAESYDLLSIQIKNKNIKLRDIIDKSWKQKIYNRFGGLPIALIYAVGKLAAGYQLDDIINREITPTDEDLGKFCFESSINRIRNTSAYHLLMAMAFFDKPPCREALIKVAGLTDGNRFTVDEIAKLKQLSLIMEEKGRYDILPITLEYVIQELATTANSQFKSLARDRWYEWYFEFTKQYGGLDWEGWRTRYDRLDVEWENIQSVLNWCLEKAEWKKLLDIWQNIDNYADLSGYWQDRRYWWALLGKNYTSAEVNVKAQSEKGFTLTLMGTQHYEDAENYLKRAWNLCSNEIDRFVSAAVANHRAVLAKVKKDYEGAHYWLDQERDLLEDCPSGKQREQKRYQIRTHYYRGEVLYLEDKLDLAKDEFNQVIEVSREIDWQRFRNYAKNILADIYIKEGNLEAAKDLLNAGFSSATQARESRRIALYQASYGRLYYREYQKEKENNLSEEFLKKSIEKAQDYATKALDFFTKELMVLEKEEIQKLMGNLEVELKELNLTIEQEENIPIDN